MKLRKILIFILTFVLICSSFSSTAKAFPLAQASSLNQTSIVLVNSESTYFSDYQHYIQPYLDHFGVAYEVLDISIQEIPALVGNHALIIIGHRFLDPNDEYLDANEENLILTSVSTGTGLINFDNHLADDTTPLYMFVQNLFEFEYEPVASASGVFFPSVATNAGYITSQHETNSSIITGSMDLAGIHSYPSDVTAVALSGDQPLVAATQYGTGKAVQFGSYQWMSYDIIGPMYGLDDLVWRSLVWAARKPFVLQAMMPFLTMRMDDVSGPFTWIETANEFEIIPWAGLFYGNIDETEANWLLDLVTNHQATASVHAVDENTFFYYNHAGGTSFSNEIMEANFADATTWFQLHGIPMSKYVVPHYYEFGTNVFQGLNDWGIEFIGIQMNPGTNYGSPWIMNGPFRHYEVDGSASIIPNYYADFVNIPGYDNRFFNCVTEIRDNAGYEWYPSNDVPGSIDRGTQQLKRALDAMALPTLFSHGYYPEQITAQNWRDILAGITTNLTAYNMIPVTMDEACEFARNIHISNISSITYDLDTRLLSTEIETIPPATAVTAPTKLHVFTEHEGEIQRVYLDVPAFISNTIVDYTIAGPVASIIILPNHGEVAAGSTYQFSAFAEDAEGNPIPNLPYNWSILNGSGSISSSGLYTAGLNPETVMIQAEYEGITATATLDVFIPELDHFLIQTIHSPQYRNAPFQVTISARDSSNRLLVSYVGSVMLNDSTGTIQPVTTGHFTNGTWIGYVTINQIANNVTITANDNGATGTSNTFNVTLAPEYYTVTSPGYYYLSQEQFPVTVTAYMGTTINLWENNHQVPVLETTTDINDNQPDDGIWTELLYTIDRPYPTILAGVDEDEDHALQDIRFYATGIPNGDYDLTANLYDVSELTYYWGTEPGNPYQHSITTAGGMTGTEHREYPLGRISITDGEFDIYVADADLILGDNPYFGWAWIRLDPVSRGIVINAWEDEHQEPILETTEEVADLQNDDDQWTEFLLTSNRTYPSVMASVNEDPPILRIYDTSIPNGTYEVVANLYDGSALQYYYSYDLANLDSFMVETQGGATGEEHREYSLGEIEITDGNFNIYIHTASLIHSGDYEFYGWSSIRLIPAILMSGNHPNLLFDSDNDGIFGEPGDATTFLDNHTFTIPAQSTSPGEITITAMDFLGHYGLNEFTINDVPVAQNQSISTNENTPINIELIVDDVYPGTLLWTVGAPQYGTLTGTAPNLIYTPQLNYYGTDSFTFYASDGMEISNTATISIVVNGANSAPVLNPIGSQSVDELVLLTFTATATDADLPPQALSFSLADGTGGDVPDGASITAQGVFSWTPTEAQGPGTYSFDVCVSDGSLSDCETISVTVHEVNSAPVLNPIGSQSVDELVLLTFTATAADADLPPQALSFSLADGTGGDVPDGASITAQGVFSWTPTEAQGPGTYSFDVCVTDGSLSDCETISVTVNESIDLLTVTGTVSMQGRTTREGVEMTLTGSEEFGPYTAISFNQITNNIVFTNVAVGTYQITTNQPRYLNVMTSQNRTKTFDVSMLVIQTLELKGGNAYQDEAINLGDASIIGSNYGIHGNIPADVNFSGNVDIYDLALVGGNFNLTSQQAYGNWMP